MSHDQNFKNLILDYPHAALALFAAAEAADLDPNVRIVPIRQEQLQERLGERFRELDVPLLVDWPDGRRAALLFVLEEESDPRRFSIHRLAHYCLDLAELCATDRVVPVVIFLGAAVAVADQLRLGGDRHQYLHFRYLRCALGELAYADYRDSDNLVARLTLPSMRYPPERRVEVYAQAVRGLTTLEPDPERRLKYLDFIDIYADLSADERLQYTHDYPDEADTMSRFAERFREEGLQQGIQKGIQQGIQEGVQQGLQQGIQQGLQQGEARLLARQLQLKFGTLSPDMLQRLAEADEPTLLAWSERLLTANRLEDVLR